MFKSIAASWLQIQKHQITIFYLLFSLYYLTPTAEEANDQVFKVKCIKTDATFEFGVGTTVPQVLLTINNAASSSEAFCVKADKEGQTTVHLFDSIPRKFLDGWDLQTVIRRDNTPDFCVKADKEGQTTVYLFDSIPRKYVDGWDLKTVISRDDTPANAAGQVLVARSSTIREVHFEHNDNLNLQTLLTNSQATKSDKLVVYLGKGVLFLMVILLLLVICMFVLLAFSISEILFFR